MEPHTTNPAIYLIIGGAFGAIVAVFFMSRLIAVRTNTILHKWAAQNEVEIVLGKVRRFPFKGPFKWGTSSPGQIVCFLKVRRRDGQERSCWIRCGNRFGGIWLGSRTEVRWEEHEPAV